MKNLLNKRIPTILSVILILIFIPLTTFILKNQTIFKSKASNSQKPQDIKITNISDKSFTVTYQTDESVTGTISYGKDKKLGESEFEDVDKEKGSFSPKKIHSISLKRLMPSTKYYLAIISGSDTFLNDKVPFEVTTAPAIASGSAGQKNIKGKIILPDGNAPSEALVYLNTDNSQLLSTTTAKDGKFSFSLEELRTDDLSSYFNVSEDTVFKIIATDGNLKSTVSVSPDQSDSAPPITLSNNYDFINEGTLTASKSAEFLSGFPSIISSEKVLKPQILNPKKDQSFTDPKPQFRGKSLPNEKVEIIIHSDEKITAQITADSNGNWTYRPPTSLSPGVHTITIKTRDSSGILNTIAQSFTVLAAETTPTPSPLPTLILIPTSTPIPTPTPTPFPTFSPIIESKGGLPPTGSSPALLIIGGAISAISGIVLFFLTRTAL